MDTLLHLIAVYGLLVVFVSVLLDQGGIPVPAYPPIILTAALATNQGRSVWPIVAVRMEPERHPFEHVGAEILPAARQL